MFNLSKILVSFFYIGYAKFAPGTIGTLISILTLFFLDIFLNKIMFFLVFVICLVLSICFINNYIKHVKKNDPSEIIIDEFLGVYVIFFFKNYLTELNIYIFLILTFLLFRFFDIFKPFPISLIDKRIKNSFGIICDDLVAGIYTTICLLVINELV